MSDRPSITAIIVTHNSPPILRRVVEALLGQSLPLRRIVIVDSGSKDPGPVKALAGLGGNIQVICEQNIGFAAANNLAMRKHAEDSDHFALVNPDAVLSPNWIAGAYAYLSSEEGRGAGIVSSPLRGMDAKTGQPTGYWDSLGIYRGRFGMWRERGRHVAVADMPAPAWPFQPKAICGALMFFSVTTYRRVSMAHGFFDERFHTYKEDVELSLRVRRRGYKLVMLPQLEAWHCRGWPARRSVAPFRARRLSALNDLRIGWSYAPGTVPFLVAKYLYVITIERWLLGASRP